MLNLRTIENGYCRATNRLSVSFASSADCGAEVAVGFKDGEAKSISPGLSSQSLLKAERILVPVDFSSASLDVLRWVISVSEQSDGIVSVLHVVHPWIEPLRRAEPYSYNANEERLKSARSRLKNLLEREYPGAGPIGVRVVIGRPAEEIVRYAGLIHTDLIVMAQGRPTGLIRWFFSHTTQKTVRFAPCPVLVVPSSAAELTKVRPALGLLAVVSPEMVSNTGQR